MKPFKITAFLCMIAGTAPALEVHQVSENVYALVGPLGQRNSQNLGNNATFGVVVTDAGVVLIDAGGSWRGAKEIDAVIDTITDQPVTYVINSGGQDHRWIGNSYWQAQGAQVIASTAAVLDNKARGSFQMTALSQLLGIALKGTEPSYADIEFASEYSFELGDETFEIYFNSQAHTPGDSFVWMPASQTVFAGDIVYVDRLLGIGEFSHSGTWIETFEAMAALQPVNVIPGHGKPTDLPTATRDAYDYLVHLRNVMGVYIDEGGDIIGSVEVDQSGWEDLSQFNLIARRNAQQVYTEMEWE